jgi:hypothetical protein
MDIPQNIDYEFHFYLTDKTTGKIFIDKIKKKKFLISNLYEIIKYEFILQGELIISRNDIKTI